MKRWFIAGTSLIIIAVLIAWRLHENAAVGAAAAQQRVVRMTAPVTVTAVPAMIKSVVHEFKGIGTVDAPADVQIAARVTGRIQFLAAQPGDPVTKGEVLVRLDPSEAQAQVQQQRAAYETARYRLAQAQSTELPNDVQVATQVREQQAAVTSAEANYAQVKQDAVQSVAAAQSAVVDAQAKVDAALASMDNARAVIASSQANVLNAESQYNRAHQLFTQGFVAAQDVDTASTAVSVQKGALNVARAQLSSAGAAKNSAQAEKASAIHQLTIAQNKGQSDIAAASAQLAQAQQALVYARANTAQKPAYRENLAALQASVDAAKGALDNAVVLLNETVIPAPMDGFVVSRALDPGAVVTAGEAILTIRYMRQVWVTIPAPEEVSRKVYIGQEAQITFDALPGHSFRGTVSQITPSEDPTTHQFPIRVTLDNSQNLIHPGMYARVSLTTERIPAAVVVPPEAILPGSDPKAVTVVDASGVAHRRTVVTGASEADRVSIVSGLKPGEKVVTVSSAPLKDGQKVRLGR